MERPRYVETIRAYEAFKHMVYRKIDQILSLILTGILMNIFKLITGPIYFVI
jgi:hypothetical protein